MVLYVDIPILQFGELGAQPTKVTLLLTDRLVKRPLGMVANVLIKICEFIFLVDFIALEIKLIPNLHNQILIILGKLFLETFNALIDCKSGVMKLSFRNMTMTLNIFNMDKHTMSSLIEVNTVHSILIPPLVLILNSHSSKFSQPMLLDKLAHTDFMYDDTFVSVCHSLMSKVSRICLRKSSNYFVS